MMMLLLWLNLYRIKVVTPGSILTSFKCSSFVCDIVMHILLCDIPDAIRKTEVLELLILDIPKLEAV